MKIDFELFFWLLGGVIFFAALSFVFYCFSREKNDAISVVSSVTIRISLFVATITCIWGNILFYGGQELWGGNKFVVSIYNIGIFLSVFALILFEIVSILNLYEFWKRKDKKLFLRLGSILGIALLVILVLLELPQLLRIYPILTLLVLFSYQFLSAVSLLDYLKNINNPIRKRQLSVIGLFGVIMLFAFTCYIAYEINIIKVIQHEIISFWDSIKSDWEFHKRMYGIQ